MHVVHLERCPQIDVLLLLHQETPGAQVQPPQVFLFLLAGGGAF